MIPASPHNVKKKTVQYPRPQPVARSKSFLGVIKDLVTAPLTWFTEDEGLDPEDINGKRRRPVQSNSQEHSVENGSSSNKRPRLDKSFDREVRSGYLDPPDEIFQQPGTSRPPSIPPQPSYRSSSVFTHSNTIQRPPHNRHSVSPLVTISDSRPSGMSRTLSTDFSKYQDHSRDVTMFPISREASMNSTFSRDSVSVGRDASMPVSRTPFRMRTSLTPQLSGSNFGPMIKPRERDPSEPPPLTSLLSNPIFVKARPETQQPRSMSAQPIATLGSIADSQRSFHVRQHSSLLGAQPGSISHIPDGYHPINPAEKALHELDVYKTPLLPTRLKAASALPDMFKPKKLHSLILMDEKDDKSRLGGTGKKRARGEHEINGTKPYAGEGGMKRLLSRRKMEEEQEKKEREKEKEKEKEDAAAMEDDGEESEGGKQHEHSAKTQARRTRVEPGNQLNTGGGPSLPPILPFASPSAAANRERSSLRVGRTKTSRNHIARPVVRSVNRFSALFDDEEGDGQMQDDSGMKKDDSTSEATSEKTPLFEIPSDFSFANEMATMEHDLTNAKEPPMTALPFSLSKPGTPPIPSLSTAKESEQRPTDSSLGPSGSLTTSSTNGSAPVSVFSTTPLAPSKSVELSEPKPTQESTVPQSVPTNAAVGTSIPNLFPKPLEFTKPSLSIAVPSNYSPTSPDLVMDAEKPSLQEKAPTNGSTQSAPQLSNPSSSEPKLSAFGGYESRPPSLFGRVNNGDSAFGASPRAAPPSLFGASVTGHESETTTSIPVPAATVPPKQLESVAPTFSFAKAVETPATSQPLFSFGVTKPEVTKKHESSSNEVAAPPSIFGSSAVTASPFKPPEKLVGSVSDPPKPAFSFSSSMPPVPTPSVDPQPVKPSSTPGSGFLFSSSITQTGPTSSNPFSYGAAPSTLPAEADKKALFSFNLPSAPSTTPGFSPGAPVGSSSVSDVSSRPFIFGATTTPIARPITPPRNEDQEFRMDESPTRDMQLNGKQAAESKPSSFSFTSTPTFSQPNPSNSAPFSFTAPGANFFPQKTENKTEQKSTVTFGGFGQNQITSSFGQKPTEIEQPKSSFSFQVTPTVSSGPSFAFRPPTTNNPFSHTASQGGSSPNSPSTFSQPSSSPFSFTAPAAPPFSFGSSQPASPAAAGSVNLPPLAAPVFSFGASTTTPATSPFGAPTPAPPPTGTLFTIGAAPPTVPPGARQVKRLPTRRGKR